jgi:hypothetical protein
MVTDSGHAAPLPSTGTRTALMGRDDKPVPRGYYLLVTHEHTHRPPMLLLIVLLLLVIVVWGYFFYHLRGG